jgi:dimethylamine monooxygenase subunit A
VTARLPPEAFDPAKRPFAIGMQPLDLAQWITRDDAFASDIALKRSLMEKDAGAVFQELAGSRPAQEEAYALLAAHLQSGLAAFADTHDSPLLSAALNLQEDLCLLERQERHRESGWVLTAGAVFFPSSWSVRDKIGKPLDDIHEPVPTYAEMLAARVNRIFDNLKAAHPVWRLNWSIHHDGGLHHPAPVPRPDHWLKEPERAASEIFMRIERQTLRRLPETGAILFTIRNHHVCLADVTAQHAAAGQIASLHAQLAGLSDSQLVYKGLAQHRQALLDALLKAQTVALGR